MPKVTFDTGQVVDFDSMPSQADIEEVANKLGINKNVQSEGKPSTNPDLQGGALSPANVKAQADLKTAQGNVSPMAQDGMATKAIAEPVGRAANSALFGIPGITSELLSGGKLVNPINNRGRVTQGGTNVFEGKDMSSGQQLTADVAGAFMPGGLAREAINGAGKLAEPLVNPFKNALKYMNPENESVLAKTVRKAAYQSKTDAVNSFGDSIDALSEANPDRTTSLRNVVDNLNQNMDEMAPEAKNVFRKTPILKDLLAKPELADNVSLRDTQDIINYINTKVPRTIKSNHLDILDTLNDTRAAQLDAFPEMADVRAKYGDFKNAFDNIKGKLKQGSLIENMAKDFGDAEVKKNVSKVFGEDILNQVKNFQQAKQVLKTAGIAGNWALKGAAGGIGADAAYEGGKRLMGK